MTLDLAREWARMVSSAPSASLSSLVALLSLLVLLLLLVALLLLLVLVDEPAVVLVEDVLVGSSSTCSMV